MSINKNKMLKKWALPLLVTILMICGCQKDPAMLKIDKHEVDFGTVRVMDGPQQVDIQCENLGDKTLRFRPVFTDCNCTTVSLPADSLKGGESMTISIKVDYHGFKPGEHFSTVKLFTNSKGGPEEIVLKSNLVANK